MVEAGSYPHTPPIVESGQRGSPEEKVRAAVVSGDALCRAGLRAILQQTAGVRVIGEASQIGAASTMTKRARPHLLFLEDSLSGVNAADAVKRLLAVWPGLLVAVLSDRADAPTVAAVLRAGAKAYLLRNVTPRSLATAIRAMRKGGVHLDRSVARKLLPDGPERGLLTPRQREVLRMVTEGYSTKRIAQILNISAKTVETHRAQLMERLGIFDVPGLVRYALKTKITRL